MDYETLIDNTFLSDCVVTTRDGKKINAHKYPLCKSGYFLTMINGNFKETSTFHVPFDHKEVILCLKFLYCDLFKEEWSYVKLEELIDFLVVAEYLQLEKLGVFKDFYYYFMKQCGDSYIDVLLNLFPVDEKDRSVNISETSEIEFISLLELEGDNHFEHFLTQKPTKEQISHLYELMGKVDSKFFRSMELYNMLHDKTIS